MASKLGSGICFSSAFVSISDFVDYEMVKVFVVCDEDGLDLRVREDLYFGLGYLNRVNVIIIEHSVFVKVRDIVAKFKKGLSDELLSDFNLNFRKLILLFLSGFILLINLDSRIDFLEKFRKHLRFELLIDQVNNRNKYIIKCNNLRSDLLCKYKHNDKKIHFIGTEKESLVNVNIINVSSLSSLNVFGLFFDCLRSSNNSMKFVDKRITLNLSGYDLTNVMNESINDLKLRGLDDGQLKLFSIMFGFVLNNDIVYVGGSPGDGWIHCLNILNYEKRVLVIDPRPLSSVRSIFKVIYVSEFVTSKDHFLSILRKYKFYDFDLVWDVRRDFEDIVNYNDQLAMDNELFNDIILNLKGIIRVQVKVSLKFLHTYVFPADGVYLYLQPFYFGRKIQDTDGNDRLKYSEVRAVFLGCNYQLLSRNVFAQSDSKFLLNEAYNLMLSMEDVNMSNDDLMYSLLGMRTVFVDSFRIEHMNDLADMVIGLFVLNLNDFKVFEEFSKCYSGELVISYFLKKSCALDEFDYDQYFSCNLLDYLGRQCFFVSSSYFGYALEDLYFIVRLNDFDVCMVDDIIFSQTYIIKYVYSQLILDLGRQTYDDVRSEACETFYCVFYKHRIYGYNDSICSPSGHMLRMVLGICYGKVSCVLWFQWILIGLFAFISYRFELWNHNKNKKYIKIYKLFCNVRLFKLVTNYVIFFLNQFKRQNVDTSFSKFFNVLGFEKRVLSCWHSYDEWVIGLRSAFILITKYKFSLGNLVYSDEECLMKAFQSLLYPKDLLGFEVYNDIYISRDCFKKNLLKIKKKKEISDQLLEDALISILVTFGFKVKEKEKIDDFPWDFPVRLWKFLNYKDFKHSLIMIMIREKSLDKVMMEVFSEAEDSTGIRDIVSKILRRVNVD